MALAASNDGQKRVPWFSLVEWHQVYHQIYSGDTLQQTRGYETLLVWKARMSKLPVGVECTLSLMQVCLRDREWAPKINNGELPMYYENDLCLMYSTMIMRFLNHISNIGHTKQTSLFQIAKELKIPEWIVNLRHDAAHGHELPAIGLLRMATNKLLSWLHDEYWRAENAVLEKQFENECEDDESENIDSAQILTDLIELWMSVGLYIEAGYAVISDLPDENMRQTLKDLFQYTNKSKKDSNNDSEKIKEKNHRLTTGRSHLLAEISTHINRKKDEIDVAKIIYDILFESEAFLPTPEFIKLFMKNSKSKNLEAYLPIALIIFWQPIIVMIHDKKMLESLILRLIELVNSKSENKQKKMYAALWLRTIGQSLLKLRIAQRDARTIEHNQDDRSKKLTPKMLGQKVQSKLLKKNPEMQNLIWFNITGNVPEIFMDQSFVTEILLNVNELTKKFIGPFLDLVTPRIEFTKKHRLLKLINIQTLSKTSSGDPINLENVIHTVSDLIQICGNDDNNENSNQQTEMEIEEIAQYADKKNRNENFELASSDFNWSNCPFGILPWQINCLEMLESDKISPKMNYHLSTDEILPGIIDNTKEISGSHVKWENVLRKKQRLRKKRQKRDIAVMFHRAIEIVKTKQV